MHLIDKVSAELLVVRENRFRARERNLFLDNMSVGEMADIVQETGREQYPAVVVVKPEPVILKAECERAGQHALQNQFHEVIDPYGVLKTGVRGTRVYLLRKRQLPYPFETKKRGVREDFFQRPAQWNVAPDRDADKSAFRLKKQVFGYHEKSVVAGVSVTGERYARKGDPGSGDGKGGIFHGIAGSLEKAFLRYHEVRLCPDRFL
jgi:hypothetical protein